MKSGISSTFTNQRPGFGPGLVLLSAVLLAGCAGTHSDMQSKNQDNLQLRPGHNQVMAWIDRDTAQTPAVARAMTLVALGNAKRETEKALCAGNWVFTGNVTEAAPPAAGLAPRSMGQYSAWHYRITWNPKLPDCQGISAERYYQTLSSHLPSWILVQAGAAMVVYRQGEPVFSNQSAGVLLAMQAN